jgi:ATP-binding cassette subfamily C protein CydC
MRELLAVLRAARRQWLWMAAGIVLGMLVIGANALLMALSGWFIASMAVSGASGIPFNYILPAAAIRALAIVRTVGRYAERLVTHEAAFRALSDLRVWLFRCLEPLAPAGLERHAGGDVAGRLRSDVDALESLYLRIIAPLAVGSLSILLAAGLMSLWSGSAAALLLIFLLLAGAGLPLLAGRMAREPGRLSTALAGELRIAVTEGLQGAEELILLGAMGRQTARVNDLSERLIAQQRRLGGITALSQAGSVACGGLGLAAVLLAGGLATASARLAGPELVMVLLFTAAAFEAAGTLPGALQMVPAAREAARRILELAEAAAPVPDPPLPAAPLPETTAIVFRDVSCAYSAGLPVLSGFNLDVPAGSRVGLVGASGIGKSTIIEILLRFRDYGGSVRVGGREIRDLAGDDLRRLISALPQRPHLFNATIGENIRLGNGEASAEELQRAVADAGLAAWIAGLPLGLDTPVGEGGAAVSGGEGRRIALARALLKDAPILLLDEPTEGLDARTEQELVNRLLRRIEGKTVLLITHRPACLALVERVVDMKGMFHD